MDKQRHSVKNSDKSFKDRHSSGSTDTTRQRTVIQTPPLSRTASTQTETHTPLSSVVPSRNTDSRITVSKTPASSPMPINRDTKLTKLRRESNLLRKALSEEHRQRTELTQEKTSGNRRASHADLRKSTLIQSIKLKGHRDGHEKGSPASSNTSSDDSVPYRVLKSPSKTDSSDNEKELLEGRFVLVFSNNLTSEEYKCKIYFEKLEHSLYH